MMPRCWTRPKTRSAARVVPTSRNHAARAQRLPGPVEVEEVPVGEVAGQHPLGEDEHEALLHRRALVAEQRGQREGDGEADDAPRRGRCPGGPAPADRHQARAAAAPVLRQVGRGRRRCRGRARRRGARCGRGGAGVGHVAASRGAARGATRASTATPGADQQGQLERGAEPDRAVGVDGGGEDHQAEGHERVDQHPPASQRHPARPPRRAPAPTRRTCPARATPRGRPSISRNGAPATGGTGRARGRPGPPPRRGGDRGSRWRSRTARHRQ